ncbi:hypothetical protein A3B57_03395 [Microgenomates group bacterium RIFCSPLOWO2_01_FULL_47_10]|nr:MAG: hypothetical protein A3B57_03395 [Microgenomates group bacterium RIFCSPLOWO2_01_FULL_47_10]
MMKILLSKKLNLLKKPPRKMPHSSNMWQKIRSLSTKKKILVGLSLLAMISIGYIIFKDLPSPAKLNGSSFPVSTLIYDRHGTLLYEIFIDENRTPVLLESLPKYVAQASIAIEDQNFYRHFGFSLQGMMRAAKNTVLKSKLQGGSTITQQLVKTALLTPERTIQRKIREAVLTVAVEILYSKNQILEMYLNHIPFGGTAYGIEAAAQKFFGKPAKDLTLAEAALLSGLPQAPTAYSPFANPDKAKARQFEVLRRMSEDGYISEQEADQAFQMELAYARPTTDIKAPHFVFYIKSLLEDKFGLQTVERGGLRVITTLDLPLQEASQASLSAQIDYFAKYKASNGAALVTKPDTGEILAMIGSRDFFNDEVDGKVNITTRLRQPGSSIKPLNYVTGLQIKTITPATILLDIPTCFQVFGQAKYCPQNYDGSFHGVTNVRSALAGSYNIPAVKVLAKNTLESFIATASAMGITSFQDPSRYGLSLTLGGGEVTMLDMATAFGTIANQGVRKNLEPFLKITDYQGNLLYQYDPDQTKNLLSFFFNQTDPDSNVIGVERGGLKRIINREPAYLMTDILADNAARSPVFGPSSKLVIKNHTVSAKTGTTNDHKDGWTLGFTPQYLVASWIGNNDNTSMSYYVSGISGAAYSWNDIMSYLLKDKPDVLQIKPDGIEGTNICTGSGLYPVDGQPCQTKFELFWKDNMPGGFTAVRKGIWVNKDTGLPTFSSLDPDAPPPNTDNLELKEHTILSDGITNDFCLDCPWTQETKEDGTPGKIAYPVTTVNTITHTTETK